MAPALHLGVLAGALALGAALIARLAL
jgi:hypothetical protein